MLTQWPPQYDRSYFPPPDSRFWNKDLETMEPEEREQKVILPKLQAQIKYAYENWKIDGVTSNPKHVKASGKPFFTIVKEFAEEFKNTNLSISVEIDPHIEKAEDMINAAKKIASLSRILR